MFALQGRCTFACWTTSAIHLQVVALSSCSTLELLRQLVLRASIVLRKWRKTYARIMLSACP
jgi:hypothetical protein